MQIFLTIAYYVLATYFYAMIISILLGWTPIRNTNFYYHLEKIVSPYLGIFRGWFVISSIDFGPMIGLILYQMILGVVARAI
ncbi:MAG: YggT family protein [Candidatus Izemoplasmatales bacterium]|jgi:uncharacterized protein YggT (Ycf19 family)|nr:YggT family protein [Candidatus Izemoplasmatales bacterium]